MPKDANCILCLSHFLELSKPLTHLDLQNPKDEYFVYEEYGKILGVVTARNRDLMGGEVAHVVVCPKHQGRGIGTKLVERAIEDLKERKLSPIWSQVRVTNKNSQRFFEKLGFKRESGIMSPESNIKLFKYVFPQTDKP